MARMLLTIFTGCRICHHNLKENTSLLLFLGEDVIDIKQLGKEKLFFTC
jgi:hypothetical protein